MGDNDLLTKTGMQLVMHGGDAREYIRRAIKEVAKGNIAAGKEIMAQANEELTKGHRLQTSILQLECDGQPQGYNILFCHGMDTLMTVKSEYEIAMMMIEIEVGRDGR